MLRSLSHLYLLAGRGEEGIVLAEKALALTKKTGDSDPVQALTAFLEALEEAVKNGRRTIRDVSAPGGLE